MRDQQRLSASPERRREELFTQRYSQLRAWALRLTNQDRESAEDLVQDAFIQFALGRTSLEDIENIDGYLRRMLRYMHLSRINRSAQKFLDQTLSFSDYDSFQQTWRAIAPPDRMQAQEELCRICAYACSRKETSRAGSVLILRFFHDYYPTEIAKILCTSRHCVDQWQRLARTELKLYLSGPTRLRFVNANSRAQTKTALTKLSTVNCDVLGELRQMIFRSRQGECLPAHELQEIYEQQNGEGLTTAKLGHLVSCPSCLDIVNRSLGLPPLTERCQPDTWHSNTRPPDDKSGSGSGGPNLQIDYRRRLREVKEHKPHELRIAINGSIVGSVTVSSDRSELDLNLGEHRIDFVEVFSEQGVQLMFLCINTEAWAKGSQWARIELSEGRNLEAHLFFTRNPRLHLTYHEPVGQPAPAETALKIVKLKSAIELHEHRGRNHRNDRPLALKQPLRLLSLVVRSLLFDRGLTKHVDEHCDRLLLMKNAGLTHKRLLTRPEFVTAVVSLLIVGALLFFRTRVPSKQTGMSLLVRATIAEENTYEAGKVTRRSITLEERRSAEGPVIVRQRIEIWQKSGYNEQARRVYDDGNRLIAGRWTDRNGSRTVYHHGSRPKAQQTIERPDYILMTLDDVWQVELSAKEFQALITDTEQARVEERATSYIVTYDKETNIGGSRLIKATLTLDRSNLHAIEESLLIERGGEMRAYRFIETSYHQVPQSLVRPSVFEIDRELVDGKAGATSVKPGNNPSTLPTVARTLPVASTELEVDVAYLLNQASGDRNEQITLSRTFNNLLRVEGVVDSKQRKLELLRALAPVSDNPAVMIDIRSVDETGTTPPSTGNISTRESEETGNTIALYDQLHDYFARTSKKHDSPATEQREDELDKSVRSFSTRTVNRAYRVLFHAVELKRLANRFAKVDMRTISPDARVKWLQMICEHAAAIERETAALGSELEPILFAQQSAIVTDSVEIVSDADLWRSIDRLHKLALANSEAIREAFTISSQSSTRSIKSSQFWRSLLEAEKLAGWIRQYQI